MKTIYTALIIILLSSPLVNFIDFDARFLDWQQYYLYSCSLLLVILNCIWGLFSRGNSTLRVTIFDCVLAGFAAMFFSRFYFTDIFSFTNDVFIKFSICILLYISIRFSRFDAYPIIRDLYIFLPIFSILLCVYGLMQFLNIIPANNLFFKMTGLFENPTNFTNFLAMLFPIVLAGFWMQPNQDRWIKVCSLIAIYLMVLTIYLGNERAAWVAFAAGLLLVANKKYKLTEFLKNTLKNSKIRYTAFCLVPAVAAGTFYLLYLMRPESFAGRWLIYKITFRIIRNHPFWGIGAGKFGSVYNLYQSRYFNGMHTSGYEHKIADSVDVAFNDFLQLFCEIGIFGFCCVVTAVVILIKIYRTVSREKNDFTTVGLVASLLTVSITAMFSYPLQNFVIMSYLLVMSALLSRKLLIFRTLSQWKSSKFFYNIGGLLYALILSSLLFNLAKSKLQWKNMAYNNQDPARSIRGYKELYVTLKDDRYFLYNYGSEMAADKNYDIGMNILSRTKRYLVDPDVLIYSGDCLLGLQDYKGAEREYLCAYYMVPKKLLPQYALMQYYHAINNDKQANAFAEKIIKAVPVAYSEDELEIKRQAAQYLIKNCN